MTSLSVASVPSLGYTDGANVLSEEERDIVVANVQGL
jgi:DNA integrity scanning protein DisA with diadenylate cyclase activity